MLEAKDVSLTLGNFKLKEISMKIDESTIHVIIGPTGSGKTTILETMIGLRRPEKGQILLNGRDITNMSVERRGLSYLPQDLCLFPHLTVRDNIIYGLKIKRRNDTVDIKGLIDRLKIGHIMHRKVTTLSGGEKQRVGLARALACGNRYLLLDEPLSSLHAGLRRELWYLLKDLKDVYNLTMIMVTHDIEEASFLADTMSVVIDGRVYQTGRGSNIYRYPERIEVASFFGIKNLFNAEIIGIENGRVYTRCHELNTTLTLHPNKKVEEYTVGEEMVIGIRAEDVMILRPEYMRKEQDNLIEGTISEIYEKGRGYIIVFKPHKAEREIEIEIADYAFNKLGIRRGGQETITLRHENIFISRVGDFYGIEKEKACFSASSPSLSR